MYCAGRYVRPRIVDLDEDGVEPEVHIVGGRHPVLDMLQSE